MKFYITEVKYRRFKKSFHELTIWEGEGIPVQGDILRIEDKRYLVLQRDLFSPGIIKLYVKEL